MPKKSRNYSQASVERRADFATAMKAAALIRKTFLPFTGHTWDKSFWERLKALTRTMINETGPDALRGKLQFTDCNIDWLRIPFNKERTSYKTFSFPVSAQYEQMETLVLKLSKTDISTTFKKPRFATSVVVRFVCAIFHFDLEKSGVVCAQDLEMPLKDYIFPGATLKIPLQAAETSVVSLAMCVWYKWKGLEVKDPTWRIGEILWSDNLVDGKLKEYVPAKEPKISPAKPKPNNNLKWEINEE